MMQHISLIRSLLPLFLVFTGLLAILSSQTACQNKGLPPQEKAKADIQSVAEQGEADAQFMLGELYSHHDVLNSKMSRKYRDVNVAYDMDQAIQWYKKAANQGHSEAQFRLGEIYYYDTKRREQDRENGIHWYEQAAENAHPEAQFRLAKIYHYEKAYRDLDQAVHWYEVAHGNGHQEAAYVLAKAYASGQGVEENGTLAMEWLKKSAEVGNKDAQYQLGAMYESGDGIPQDPGEALRWYGKAAKQDHHLAQTRMGILLLQQNNAEEAGNILWQAAPYENEARIRLKLLIDTHRWMPATDKDKTTWKTMEKELAILDRLEDAEAGDRQAQFDVASQYNRGSDVSDKGKALYWYKKAADQGDVRSLAQYKRLREALLKDKQGKMLVERLEKTNKK